MDKYFETAGAFGIYQICMIALIGGLSSFVSMCIYAIVFVGGESELICNYYENNEVTNRTFTNTETCDIWLNLTSYPNSSYKCDFDRTYYDKTIMTEWNLVCDRYVLISITQTSHMVGGVCSFFAGYFGDRYGRRKSTLVFCALLCLVLILTELGVSPVVRLSITVRFIIYTIGQFLIGMLVNCCYCVAYILLLELTSSKYRTKISNINSYIYALGELNAMFAYYFTKNWHSLNWIMIAYSVTSFVLAIIFLPESPEWLISMERYNEAYKLLLKIATVNRKKKQFLDEYNDDLTKFYLMSPSTNNQENNSSDKDSDDNIINKEVILVENNNEIIFNNDDYDTSQNANTFKRIFYPKKILIKTLLLFYIWNALNLVFYGISLGITSINAINPYHMYFYSCIAEIVGVFCCHINDIIGRRKTFSVFLVISCITCSIVALIPNDFELSANGITLNEIFIVIFALLGKAAISGAYNIIYIYTAELYPTTVRNTAVLFLVCFGCFGSFVAPQVNFLRTIWGPLPYVIFGVTVLLSCICVIFLPETKGKASKI